MCDYSYNAPISIFYNFLIEGNSINDKNNNHNRKRLWLKVKLTLD